eukprot:scaffold103075_cov54-Phaeocystis_antarctica.AAC.1
MEGRRRAGDAGGGRGSAAGVHRGDATRKEAAATEAAGGLAVGRGNGRCGGGSRDGRGRGNRSKSRKACASAAASGQPRV